MTSRVSPIVLVVDAKKVERSGEIDELRSELQGQLGKSSAKLLALMDWEVDKLTACLRVECAGKAMFPGSTSCLCATTGN